MSTKKEPIDINRLPLGIDHLPFRVYFAILVNVAERFTYYGLTIPFRMITFTFVLKNHELINSENFIQNSYKSGDHNRPGVLGLGQSAATAITNGFFFFQMIMAIGGAVLADGWLGRYKLLVICSL
jgi:POT family proton-dependent oligopeptide transporter